MRCARPNDGYGAVPGGAAGTPSQPAVPTCWAKRAMEFARSAADRGDADRPQHLLWRLLDARDPLGTQLSRRSRRQLAPLGFVPAYQPVRPSSRRAVSILSSWPPSCITVTIRGQAGRVTGCSRRVPRQRGRACPRPGAARSPVLAQVVQKPVMVTTFTTDGRRPAFALRGVLPVQRSFGEPRADDRGEWVRAERERLLDHVRGTRRSAIRRALPTGGLDPGPPYRPDEHLAPLGAGEALAA